MILERMEIPSMRERNLTSRDVRKPTDVELETHLRINGRTVSLKGFIDENFVQG